MSVNGPGGRASELERLWLAAIVESSEDAIIGEDLDGKVRSWNRGAERMLGYTAAEMIGQFITVLAPPGLEDDSPQILERIRRGERVAHYDTSRRRKDGTVIDVSLTVSPVRDGAGTVIGASKIARDITARKRQEANAREIAEALDLAPIMIRDLDGTIRFWGIGARDLYGFAPSEATGRVSHTLLRTVFPCPLDEIQAELLRQGCWRGELRHHRSDGAEVIVTSIWTVRRDESGAPRAVVEVNTDVTAARHAEFDCMRLAAIVESSDDAIISNDLTGTIKSWNRAAERMLGYSATEMIGRNIALLAPPGFEADMSRILGQIRRGHLLEHYETRRRRKDGTIIDVSLTISPMRDPAGTVIGASKIARDITGRKQAEQALRDSEQRFRALLENSPRIMWVNAADGTLEFFNAAWRDYTGHSESAPDGQWADVVHAEDLQAFLQHKAEAIARGESYGLEYRLRRRDGVHRWHATRVSPLREDGKVQAWVGTATDIDDIRRLAEVLEERVAERTRKLAELNAELEAFTYSVAHDLRAPLRSMRGFSVALLEDYAECLDETGRDFVTRIRNGAERMDRLIHDLLEYSRLTRAELRPQPVRLATILAQVLEQLRGALAETGAEIRLEGELPTVLGQRSVLHQVLANLVDNAIKFVPPGHRPRIRILAARDGPTARITVVDNGIGFEEKHAERVFRVFERLHGAGSAYPGTGIGLAIVRKGIERLGGRVGVDSAPGQGSRFWLELPLAES